MPVEVIVEKEIIKEVPVEVIVEKEIIKEVLIDKDKFASESLRRPDGTQIQLKRNPSGTDKMQGSLSEIGDSGILTKKDRVHREVKKETGQKRLDPWTGNLRWHKAKYEKDDENPNKDSED